MAYNSSKLATCLGGLRRTCIAEIQAEARLERAMGLWDATFPDDDEPRVPNPLDSPQIPPRHGGVGMNDLDTANQQGPQRR
jgi:hypothetical protein